MESVVRSNFKRGSVTEERRIRHAIVPLIQNPNFVTENLKIGAQFLQPNQCSRFRHSSESRI